LNVLDEVIHVALEHLCCEVAHEWASLNM
jgi:hypothetical protein